MAPKYNFFAFNFSLVNFFFKFSAPPIAQVVASAVEESSLAWIKITRKERKRKRKKNFLFKSLYNIS